MTILVNFAQFVVSQKHFRTIIVFGMEHHSFTIRIKRTRDKNKIILTKYLEVFDLKLLTKTLNQTLK